ncbi:hypothetical protein [Microvirga guangxiensis]|uniref:Uncharacterized protein n=1 Tax=Microvirga guangxiensis TaxID=549386 RepID=A0A1G5L6B1_9HYPH|nr:hypothetical protein [Microvirga guangxiensis]SCZ07878.1 hypothetical protein SAMN02927923_03926 [Microvirga guangxiensis]
MRTTMGSAQKLHLDRAARIAGEAFAFDEPDTAPVTKSSTIGSSLLWLSMAAALIGLSFAF